MFTDENRPTPSWNKKSTISAMTMTEKNPQKVKKMRIHFSNDLRRAPPCSKRDLEDLFFSSSLSSATSAGATKAMRNRFL